MPSKAKDGKREALQEPDAPTLLSRPLESLLFLIPLILFYEIGCLIIRPAGNGPAEERVVAFYLLQLFLEIFGSTAIWMPPLAVVIILLCTHAASRRPWTVRRRAVAMMYVESLALAVPLTVFSHVLAASPTVPRTEPAQAVFTEVVLGVGAGVYEELVFRLILISLITMIAAEFFNGKHHLAVAIAIVISSLAFSAHHHPPLGSEPFTLPTFLFRALAGAYLGVLFVYRGYGPAAGTHVAYNLMVTLLT